MVLPVAKVQTLMQASECQAWRMIVAHTLATAREPLTVKDAAAEIMRRERAIGELDVFLAGSGWELWYSFAAQVERTAQRLQHWWTEPFHAKAVLILDGLSLRELPWLLQGAQQHGFTLHQANATASELPGDTSAFAHALGFSSRSKLQNNGGGPAHSLQPARTESADLPWPDCTAWVDSSPNQIFWHHWPDAKLHDGSGAGQGLDTLTQDVASQLSSADFWAFVARLAQGRRLVITSDHGYAATGTFADADGESAPFLKQTFASRRSREGTHDPGAFSPPVALQMDSSDGSHLLALGRRKWRSQGGYPTLTHGGLSLLEVLSPFVEISKPTT